MNVNSIIHKCVGCGICEKICPKDCIEIKKDIDGFYIPFINEKDCIDCGLCIKKCSVENVEFKNFNKLAFYGTAQDSKMVKLSTSGGVFGALANYILENGGVVFGAAYFPEDKEVRHVSTRVVSVERLYRSKYVESNLANSFNEVQKELNDGINVLFCGTPCQVNALKKFVNDPNNLLITCDFICHGVPSSNLLKEHLEYYERKYKAKITHIDFRPKEEQWAEVSRLKIFSDVHPNGYSKLWSFDRYYKGFYTNNTLRESCYNCSFSKNHNSDIILADFWGYKALGKNLNTKEGLSLVIANSNVGISMINKINENVNLISLDYKYAEYIFNPDDISNCLVSRNNFFKEYRKKGFIKASSKTYAKNINLKYYKFKLIKSMKKIISKGKK